MSPASQGSLEVKRYIGSCLFSASTLRKTGGGGGAKMPCEGGWAGLPLISMATAAPRPGAFSRLAMHTQGAPLILAGRYGGRKHGQRQQQQQQQQQRPQRAAEGQVQQAAPRRHAPAAAVASAPAVTRAAEGAAEAGRATSNDSLNTASDESSGPSENSLPRIIKPRKRRKKDRKPLAAAPPARQLSPAPSSPEAAAPDGSSIVTLRPYVPLCYELYDGARAVANSRRPAEPRRRTAWEPDKSRPQQQLARKKPPPARGDARDKPAQQQQQPPQQQQQQKEERSPPPASPSVCQCRYCDPRGHIWDVGRHCYSPVLTAPDATAFDKSPFASIPLFLSAPPAGDAADTDDGFFSEDLPLGDAEDWAGDAACALRRSWSGCSSSSGSSLASAPGRARTAPIALASQGLEVSTEIVTSPNGHRDLEIRFYSCSPPAQDRHEAPDAGAHVRGDAAWASRPGAEDDDDEEEEDEEDDGEGECAEKFLGESLWANIQADEHGAKALGDEVLQLSIRAEE